MSHTNIMESGTCAALPLRDAWGRPRKTDWCEPAPIPSRPPRSGPHATTAATRPQAWTLPVSA